MVSRDEGGKLTLKLSVREWIAIITLLLGCVGSVWHFTDGVKTELTAVRTKVDLMWECLVERRMVHRDSGSTDSGIATKVGKGNSRK